MKTLVIIDIDGTIADAARRFKEAGPEPSRDDKVVYDAWINKVQNTESLLEDNPVPGMVSLTTALAQNCDQYPLVYLTAREERWRKVTEAWLLLNQFPFNRVVMRGNTDYREGVHYKEEMIEYARMLYNADAVIVIDDDPRDNMAAMCKRNGWTFLLAMSGGRQI